MASLWVNRRFQLSLSLVLVSIPFLVVQFPPITDLPQVVAQVPLFSQAISDPAGPYEIRWLAPHSASYLVIGLAWILSPPVAAGRLAMLAIGLLWVVAIHALAAARERPAGAAILASLCFFSHPMYWGFYSFVFGWPAFLLFFVTVSPRRREATPLAGFAAVLGLALLLYFSHLLWFVLACAWLAISSVAFPLPWRRRRAQIAGMVPVAVLAAVWFSTAPPAATGQSPGWIGPLSRLDIDWLITSTLGGVWGSAEGLLLSVFLLWLLGGAWAGLRRKDAWDRELLVLGAFLFLLALLGPDKWRMTIELNTRWAPCAMACLLLAAPSPPGRPLIRSVAVAVIAAAFTLRSAQAWREFERKELSGLEEVLKAVPPSSRVIGLDYVRHSEIIRRRPFLQVFSYTGLLKGCSLHFSFAELPQPLVGYRRGRPEPPWPARIEWWAERARPSDLLNFDYAVVNGDDEKHRALAAAPFLLPVTREGRFRLYAVRPAEGAAP